MAEPNWKNRTIWTHNNLEVMRGMNSNCIDLIYLDPPFNSKANYAAPIGSKAAGAEFKDTWTLSDVDEEWITLMEQHPKMQRVLWAAQTASDRSYLIYMAVRILEMHRILKETGSIYLHCDPTMSHYLKLLMDSIFGRSNFRNEVVWYYYNKYSAGKKQFGRNYDQVLFYAKGTEYIFNPQREERDKPTRQLLRENVGGVLKNKRGPDGKVMYRTVHDKKVDAVWRIPCVQPAARECTGYPTQKPLALLDRIIMASSNKGDLVFDPFCGCATTMVSAEILGRKWAGVDVSPVAVRQVKQRLHQHAKLGKEGKRTLMQEPKPIVLKAPPQRTDLGKLLRYNHPSLKKKMYGEQEGNCNFCGEWQRIGNLEVDHIVAQSKGGTDHPDNLQLLCRNCNGVKGNRGMEYLKAEMQKFLDV